MPVIYRFGYILTLARSIEFRSRNRIPLFNKKPHHGIVIHYKHDKENEIKISSIAQGFRT